MRRTVTLLVIFLSVFLQARAESTLTSLGAVPERPDSGYRWIDRIDGYNWMGMTLDFPDYMREFHQEYGKLVKEVLDGGENCLSDPSLGKFVRDQYGIGTYDLKIVSFYDTIPFTFSSIFNINSAQKNAIIDYCNNSYDIFLANQFIDYLLLSLNFDYPEAYWINNYSRFIFDTSGSRTIGYDNNTHTGTIAVQLDLLLLLTDDSNDCRYYEFLDDSDVGMHPFNYQSVDLFNNSIDSILAYAPVSRCAKVVYFNDWLTNHNGYCTDNPVNANPTVRSSYSAITGRSGLSGPVCEGYARAFKILCDRSGIPCIVVTGYARPNNEVGNELHMWNEVMMEDGRWYAVDVTWDDPVGSGNQTAAVSGNEDSIWVLKGRDDIMGSGNFSFSNSHIKSMTWNSDYKGDWIYSLNTLANTGYVINWLQVRKEIEEARTNSVRDIPYGLMPGYLRAYSMDGRYLGTFSTFDGMCRFLKDAGNVIVNGKKVYIR